MRPQIVAISIVALSLTLLVPAVVIGGQGTDGTTSIDRIETWQAPANETGFEDSADIRTAIEDGSLSRATSVNASHLLVVELEVDRFESAVDQVNRSTKTEQFQAALSEHGGLEIRQTNMGPQKAPLVVDALNGTGVTVYTDAANDTYYLTIDLADATAYRNDSPEEIEYEREYEFGVRAILDADSPLTDTDQVAATAVTSRVTSIDTAPDDRVHLRSLPNQTITGTTNLGMGSTVTVVVTGDSDPETDANESFRLTREATVDLAEDRFRYEGRFDATFDMTDVPPAATNVMVDVRVEERSMLETPVPARVNEYSSFVDANEVLTDGGSAGVNVTSSLSAGGFLVLHADTADGPIVGHSPYLEPGEETVTVYVDQPVDADELVVIAHRDGNYNEWFDGPETDTPYTGQGSTDSTLFDVELSDDTPVESTPTDTRTDSTPTATETPAVNKTTPDEGTPESGESGTDSSGVSGVTGTVLPVVGVLLAAVILVALLRVRQ